MISSSARRNVINPITYDVQYLPPSSTRVVRTYSGSNFRQVLFQMLFFLT